MKPTADRFADRHVVPTPLGPLLAVADDAGLRRLDFIDDVDGALRSGSGTLRLLADELEQYFAGEPVEFRTPLAPVGTPFQQAVWEALCDIPHGETRSYRQIAAAIGRPKAVRAVGAANGRNPISILVPCHRVIGADGGLTGYASGLERKRRLLEIEGRRALFSA